MKLFDENIFFLPILKNSKKYKKKYKRREKQMNLFRNLNYYPKLYKNLKTLEINRLKLIVK